MIQIAFFATIPVKAKRARPRAAFHSICRALKNLRQIRNNTHVLRKLSNPRGKNRVSNYFYKRINSQQTRKKILRTRAPRNVLSHEMTYPDV